MTRKTPPGKTSPGPAKRRSIAAVLALVASCGLAGCNETGGAGASPTTAVATAPASGFGLPPGAPCSGEIGRYEAVVKDDLATGNVARKVYDQIQGELARAASACSAGKGAEAHGLIAASKARHGYRA